VPGRVVEQLLRGARIQVARDIDRGKQGFAAGGRLERQPQEGRQVAAQVAVARSQLVHETALLQAREGAAVRPGLAQVRLAQLLVQRADGCCAVGVEQHVYGGEQGVQSALGPPSQGALLVLERQARPPLQPGHVLVVHGDGLVQQPLAGFDQEGRDKGVALGCGKALERLGIVPAPELGEVLHELRRGRGKVHPGPKQALDEVKPREAGRNRRRPCRGRRLLEMGQRGPVLAVRHVHQVFDGVTQPLRQTSRDAVEQVLNGMGRDGGDQALQRTRRRQHDPPGAEQVFGQHEQRPGQHPLGSALLQPVAQRLLGGPVAAEPKLHFSSRRQCSAGRAAA